MENQKSRITFIILWAARISGGIVLLLFISSLAEELIDGNFMNSTFNFYDEAWKKIVFFAGTILGLLLAYKWEGLGGLLTTVALIVSGFIHPLVMIPGLLYIVYYLMRRSGM